MNKIKEGLNKARFAVWDHFQKHKGIDGIIVAVGLCIIALVICVVMKDQLIGLVEHIVAGMTTKADGILAPSNYGI